MIWGKRDPALGAELAPPSIALCDAGRRVFIDEATHWVHHDMAEHVNDLLLDVLRDGTSPPSA